MAVNKNFVVKNGLEVNDDLILANPTNSRVGIGTSVPQYTLHAFGGIGATSLHVAGVSNKTRGIWAGGAPNSPGNQIQYITFDTVGNSTDVANLTQGRRSAAGNGSGTLGRGVIGGGVSLTSPGGSGHYNYIDYFAIDSTSNAVDFGDLTQARYWITGAANATRGTFFGGAYLGPYTSVNTIDYVEMATTGNASDFGDALEQYEKTGGCSGD